MNQKEKQEKTSNAIFSAIHQWGEGHLSEADYERRMKDIRVYGIELLEMEKQALEATKVVKA